MICFVLKQSLGMATGPHSPFRDYSIDAVSLRVMYKRNPQTRLEFILRVAETMEAVIRSCSNLVERLNRSYYYYLLVSEEKFVPIEIYILPVVLLMLSLFLKVQHLIHRPPHSLKIQASEIQNDQVREASWIHIKFAALLILMVLMTCCIVGCFFKCLLEDSNFFESISEDQSTLSWFSTLSFSIGILVVAINEGFKTFLEAKSQKILSSHLTTALIWMLALTLSVILLTILICSNW